MNQRIRYQSVQGTSVLKSRRVFKTADGKDVSIELDTASLKFTVRDSITGEPVLNGGNTRNLSVLKIQAKNGLQSLGVQFAAEARNR